MTRGPDTTAHDHDDLAESHHVTDPITGTTGVGPLEPGAGRPGGNWGLAARWMAFAFIIIAAALLLVWMFGER